METVRPMSILPAIKCSNCGSEIEISSMGDHVCAHDNTVEPVTRDVYGAGHMKQHASNSRSGSVPSPRMYNQSLGAVTGSGSQLKAPRTAPPRIDAAAASESIHSPSSCCLLTRHRQTIHPQRFLVSWRSRTCIESLPNDASDK